MIGYSDVLARLMGQVSRESDWPQMTARFWKKCTMEI